jgi:hypothetical protein
MESAAWSAFQDSDIFQSITSDYQTYNLFKDNTHDPGAQKNGENQKVNVNMTVLNERNIDYLVINAAELDSALENMGFVFGFEHWTKTKFWRKWEALSISLPVFILICLTKNNISKLLTELAKGFRDTEDISLITA